MFRNVHSILPNTARRSLYEHFEFFDYSLSSSSSSITWQPAPASVQRRVASSPATTADPFDPALRGSPQSVQPPLHKAEYEQRSGTTSSVLDLAPAMPSRFPGECPLPCPFSYTESQILSRHRLASFTNKKGNRSSE
ncbi:AAEL016991-PA [Aedes aegypti]|uniref:AAEL016991-PA n=1 Tax=Aedes aegypti TaxID=7159 RepID=J9I078_AEDAE|nr:AAEL016991-PA [Aedes aegypti]